MPLLALFPVPGSLGGRNTSDDRASQALEPNIMQGHYAYIRRLRDRGYVQSCRSSQSSDADGFYGYILLCSTLEEAQTLAQGDPLWLLCKGNARLIPWALTEGDEHMKIKSTAATQQRRSNLGFDPIFPVTDMQRSLRHYQALGFETEAYDGEYAFATLATLGCIHLTLQTESYDPRVSAAATYLHVEDADALAAKWKRDCPGEDTREPVDTEYGLREGAHLDPDNNLIRFGSKIVRGESNE